MPIYVSSNKIGELYFGGNQIGEAYYGNTLVYQNYKVLYLSSSTATSWNIKSLYPALYSKLSADNFFFTTANSISVNDTINVPSDGLNYQTITHGKVKTYDTSSGTLNMYHWLGENNPNGTVYGKVRGVLVTKTSKLISLGTGTTFNVKAKSDKYASFTADNFLIKTWNPYNSNYLIHGYRGIEGRWIAVDTKTLVKSYNASTGQLTCYFRDVGSTNINESWDYQSTCEVYLTLDRPQ